MEDDIKQKTKIVRQPQKKCKKWKMTSIFFGRHNKKNQP